MSTLMSRFSNQFKAINAIMDRNRIKRVELNKAKPRFNPLDGNMTKGVDSDHLKIYEINSNLNFGFAFNYTNGENSITVTIKRKDKEFFDSAIFDPNWFKQHLNDFVNLITKLSTEKRLTALALEDVVVTNFISVNKLDVQSIIKENTKSLTKKVNDLKKENQKIQEKQNSKIDHLENLAKEHKAKLDALKEELDFERIRKEYDKASAKISKLAEKFYAEEFQAKRSFSELDKEVSQFDRKIQDLMDKETEKLPKFIREQVQSQVKRKN